jgi:hypothetical protein
MQNVRQGADDAHGAAEGPYVALCGYSPRSFGAALPA